MNWIGVAVGAATGGLAVLVSTVIIKLLGKSVTSKGARILHVIIFSVAVVLGRELLEPRIQAHRVEAMLLELPVYKALKQHEPEAYARIRSTFEQGIASKLPTEQIWAATRPVIGEITSRRLPHVSDEVIVRFGQHIVTAMNVLYDKGGTSCFSYINPAPGESLDFNALLGKEMSEQELNLIAEVVSSAAGKTQPKITGVETESDIEYVIGQLLTRHTLNDLAVLQNPNSPTIDKRKFCQVTCDLYKEALALPPPRNSKLLRYFVQSQ